MITTGSSLRLADIYLLYAEALVRQGKQLDVALTYLNKIRQRARNSTGGAPGISSRLHAF